MKLPDGSEFEALAEAVAKRLSDRFPGSPKPGNDVPLFPRPQLPWEPMTPLPDDLLRRRKLGIAGMELTQSIQHHGTAGPSYGADNSVPLVALKTLVVRVYPNLRPGLAGLDAPTSDRATGELVLSVGSNVIYRTGPTRAAGARVGSQSELSRTLWDEELTAALPGPGGIAVGLSHINCSLNFRVPAYYCRRGRMHVAVRIWLIGVDGSATSTSAVRSEYVEFLDVGAPRIALVRVNWDNGAGTITKPSDADMLQTLRLAERMLPFPYFETTILSQELTKTGAFAMAVTGGACNQAWQDLNTDLAVTRIFAALFGLGDIVFGMVPRAVIPPTATSINDGCGIETGGCIVGQDVTFAHEIGHLYGRAHVAVGDDPSSDLNYPKYGGRVRSIGEVGIDTGTSPPILFDGETTNDLMSYRQPKWISPYTYRGILDGRFRADGSDRHQTAKADPSRVRPLLIVAIRVRRTAQGFTDVELKRAFRVEAAGVVARETERAVSSPMSVDLLDTNHRILATHHCFYVAPQPSCGCGSGGGLVPIERQPYLDLFEVIEWPGEQVAALSFHRGQEPFATVEVGEPPHVQIEGPERREERLVVRVHAQHPRATPSVAVLFSGDDGVTWVPVGFDPLDGELSVDAERLPGGKRCRFRVIAGAELQSAMADTDPFEVRPATRRLFIVTPGGECGILPGPVALSALIDTRGQGAVAPHEIRWHSALQGELGAGYDLTANLLEGEHLVTATAPDGKGGLLSERAIIIVGGRPVREQR